MIGLARPPRPIAHAPRAVGEAAAAVPALPETGNVLLAFPRHVGCPFAEAMVIALRGFAAAHPAVAVLLVSQGAAAPTEAWLAAIGGAGGVRVICDPDLRAHAAWGVGERTAWHFMGWRSLAGVMRLRRQGIINRDAAGTRWVGAAMFLIRDGRVAWRHVPASAEAWALPPGALLG